MELTADCQESGTDYSFTVFSMKELVNELKDQTTDFEIDLVCLTWNKLRSDSERKTVTTFLYKN